MYCSHSLHMCVYPHICVHMCVCVYVCPICVLCFAVSQNPSPAITPFGPPSSLSEGGMFLLSFCKYGWASLWFLKLDTVTMILKCGEKELHGRQKSQLPVILPPNCEWVWKVARNSLPKSRRSAFWRRPLLMGKDQAAVSISEPLICISDLTSQEGSVQDCIFEQSENAT